MTSQHSSIENEQFLKAPALFTKGPWFILVAGALLCLLVVLLANSRIVHNRKAEYEKVLASADVLAQNAAESTGQLVERLWQVTYMFEGVGVDQPLSSTQALSLHRIREEGVHPFALDASGKLRALIQDDERLLPSMTRAVNAAHGARGQSAFQALPEGGLVIQTSENAGPTRMMVYFIDKQTLLASARQFVGEQDGVMVVKDGFGSALFEAEYHGGQAALTTEPKLDRAVQVRTAVDAMAGGADVRPDRLLVGNSSATKREAVVTIGLREGAATAEFVQRAKASWYVVATAVGFFMLLTLFVVFALLKFKRTEAYLRRLATTDILTNLPNRRSFHHLLGDAVKRAKTGRELALVFVDVDNFKDVNDTAGHPTGDAMLQHIAKHLRRAVRPSDVVCRLAGDEFTVLAEGVSTVDEAVALGQRIIRELNGTFLHEGVEYKLQLSAGVALMPAHAQTAQELMQFADTTLYRAKTAGKGRCVSYSQTMTQQDLLRKQTLQDLERALTQEDELVLVYQPKYHLATGALVGHEALIRWQHPTRGMVFPNDFIPLAEEAGLIGKLGNWVIRRAVRQIRQWHDQGLGWQRVAVNVSALQLADQSLISHIADVLGEFKVRGGLLQVEVTESTLASHKEVAAELLRKLRGMGVTVAVDDFGTGFSCLSMLSEFEIDLLKVDRSFVKRIDTKGGLSICRAIINLGQSIGATVIAEGVEVREQAQALAELGCNEVQGYYFAKPQPAELAPTLTAVTGFLPADDGARVQDNAVEVVNFGRAA